MEVHIGCVVLTATVSVSTMKGYCRSSVLLGRTAGGRDTGADSSKTGKECLLKAVSWLNCYERANLVGKEFAMGRQTMPAVDSLEAEPSSWPAVVYVDES